MSIAIAVTESSGVGVARRAGAQLTSGLAFDEAEAGRAAIVITEIATNLVKHAGGGTVILGTVGGNVNASLHVLGLDRGRGIPNLGESLRDGYSTAGSPGTGLGAVMRLSTAFDIYSQPDAGTVVFAAVGPGKRPAATLEIGAVSIPARGETVCGDGWAVMDDHDRPTVLVVDGLGHGVLAAEAAEETLRAFRANGADTPRARLETIHAALKPTRGAAVALAELAQRKGTVTYAGIGNVTGAVIADSTPARHLVSHNGIAGHEARRIDEFSYPWTPAALLVMHTDGLTTKWDLAKYPGLAMKHPAVIAGVLYRDFHRAHDDATVVVARVARR